MTIKSTLVDMRELLIDPTRWTKHTSARDPSGFSIDPNSSDAVCWCILGALVRVQPDGKEELAAYRLLDQEIQRVHQVNTVVTFNDRRTTTHDDVLQFLDKAIARAGELNV